MENNFSRNHLDPKADGLDAYGSDPNAPVSSVYVDFLGHVGIGTKTPQNKLDVEGSATINGSLTINDTSSGSFSVTPAANKIPVSDKSGHIDAGWIVNAPGFLTGDTKLTYRNIADVGWIMLDEGTIGNSDSGATTRANADTQDLFVLLWNNVSQTNCPVSGDRGTSALADFNANKTLGLPLTNSRVIGITGTGSSLSKRGLADIFGEEKHALTSVENGPHTHGYTTLTGTSHVYKAADYYCWTGTTTAQTSSSGSGTPHNIMQPTAFLNMMIKL